MGRIVTALLGLMLTLSACSGDAEPSPPPSSAPPSTPASTPSPTAPVMPEAAKAHTKAGAKAFVEYFWEVVDYAGAALDAGPLEDLTADGCVGCEGAIKFVRDMRAGGAQFVGSETKVSKFQVADVTVGGQPRTELVFAIATPEQLADYPGTDRDEHYPAATSRARFLLKPVADGWRVVLWESA